MDCVRQIRKVLRLKRKDKIGHSGTLDPNATGAIAIGLGRSVKYFDFLRKSKIYRATFRFGIKTDTDDVWCRKVISERPVPWLNQIMVERALSRFVGLGVPQRPPNVSAKRVRGQRLYELARRGKENSTLCSRVNVRSIEIEDFRGGDFPEVDVIVDCDAGTYVRSIARDVGDMIHHPDGLNVFHGGGIGGVASLIERAQCGWFRLDRSVTFEDLERLTNAEIERLLLIPTDRPLQGTISAVVIDDPVDVSSFRNGAGIDRQRFRQLSVETCRDASVDEWSNVRLVYRKRGREDRLDFLGLGRVDRNILFAKGKTLL